MSLQHVERLSEQAWTTVIISTQILLAYLQQQEFCCMALKLENISLFFIVFCTLHIDVLIIDVSCMSGENVHTVLLTWKRFNYITFKMTVLENTFFSKPSKQNNVSVTYSMLPIPNILQWSVKRPFHQYASWKDHHIHDLPNILECRYHGISLSGILLCMDAHLEK